MSNTAGDKLLVKNTIVIYIRLAISVIIGLYTSRVVLQVLGVENFGLYTIVGGIVAIMNFLSISLSTVSYRYISVEIGKGAKGDVNRIYNTVTIITIGLAALFTLIGETFGVYYIINVAHFDPLKVGDALFVLHLSVITTVLFIVSIPCQGLIMSNEKFVFTSGIQIISSVLNLGLIIWLSQYGGNRLRAYSIIVACVASIIPISNQLYCNLKYRDVTKWKLNHKADDYIEIFQYAFWIVLGSMATIAQRQGANVIINLFFTTATNAAFGLATTVNNYVTMFVQGINQAVVPQIMKSSESDSNRALSLMYKTNKYTFYLMLLPTFPLIFSLEFVLETWLGVVPECTIVFTLFMLITGTISSIGAGFDPQIQATGKIKSIQLFYSIINVLTLPIAYFLFKAGMPVYIISILLLLAAFFYLLYQVFYLRRVTKFRIKEYYNLTLKPCLKVVIGALLFIPFKLVVVVSFMGNLCLILLCILYIALVVFLAGLNKSERNSILAYVKKILRRL